MVCLPCCCAVPGGRAGSSVGSTAATTRAANPAGVVSDRAQQLLKAPVAPGANALVVADLLRQGAWALIDAIAH